MRKQKRVKKTHLMRRRIQISQVLAILKKRVSQTLRMDSLTQFLTRMTKTVRTGRICRVEAMTDVQQLWRIVKRPCKRTRKLLDSILLLRLDITILAVVEVDEEVVVAEDVAVEEATRDKDVLATEALKIVVEIITTETTIAAVDTRIEAEEVVIRMIIEVVIKEVEVDIVMEEMTIQKVNGDLIIGVAMAEIAIGMAMEEIAIGMAMEETATEEKTKEVVISRVVIQAEVAMVVSSMARERP